MNVPGALTTDPYVRAWSVSRRRRFESHYVQIFIRFLNKYLTCQLINATTVHKLFNIKSVDLFTRPTDVTAEQHGAQCYRKYSARFKIVKNKCISMAFIIN